MAASTFGWLLVTGLLQVVRANDAQQPLLFPAHNSTPTLYHVDLWDSVNAMNQMGNVLELAGLDVWHISPERGAFVYVRDAEEEHAIEKILGPIDDSAIKRRPIANPPFSPTAGPDHSYPANHSSTSYLPNSTYHNSYHPLPDLEALLFSLHDAYPDIVTIVEYGRSSEGRSLLGAVIREPDEPVPSEDVYSDYATTMRKTGKKGEPDTKLAFVISGAQHAREWIATSTATYLTHALASNASEPGSLRQLLKHYDFHIISAPNPDGYVYTWEHDRFWYKNRQALGRGVACTGLDLNRNWGYKWRPVTHGSADFEVELLEDELLADDNAALGKKKKPKKPKPTPDPCSASYPGQRPFQAPEVNALANYIDAIGSGVGGAPSREVGIYLDLRSFGQMLSTPYSYSCQRIPRDNEDQLEAAMGATKRMRTAHGVTYKAGRLCEHLYNAYGNVMDYMYKRAGIKYSYSLHLRDTGTYGFLIPPEWIRPVGEETAQFVSYISHFVAREHGLPDAS
ncbi:hypothetical protein BD626DRAFT_486289 [Schizophyllum amplum]|uniref:Inactive metallocarboxypeptidase ECM14 n=1 Tax=Schizophyllum amplum TaxID=97359 RepID=A0A550CMF0_9AGAR|nr:hypothetical protein BD626DRAFT_486289 [Auriculariopsis ampla]